jgi:DNA-binding protein YbaB
MTELEFTSKDDTVFIDLNGHKEPFAQITRPRCLDSEKAHYAEQIAAAMNDKFKTP